MSLTSFAGKRSVSIVLALALIITAVAAMIVLRAETAAAREAEDSVHLTLAPLSGAPAASGRVELDFERAVLDGSIRVRNLPAQPYGTGKFYGVWFVRTDTGDKAFLGALAQDQSIIFSVQGSGAAEFAATHFTTGPDAGSAITRGPAGVNLLIVLIENSINGLTPSPVGQAAEVTF